MGLLFLLKYYYYYLFFYLLLSINDQDTIKLSFAKVLEPEELKPSKDKLYHITVEKSYPDVFPIKLEKIYNLNMIKN